MNENKKNAWLYVALTVVASVIAVIFQYILQRDYLESPNGLYFRGASTPVAFYIFLSIAVVLFFTSAFMFRKELLPAELKIGSWYRCIAAAFAALAIMCSGLMFFIENSGIKMPETGTLHTLKLLGAGIAILCGVFYLALMVMGKRKSNAVAFLSFFAVLWTLVYLLGVCFDKTGLVNSPVKMLRQFALIFLMLYQLLESRALIGKPAPKLYFIFSNLAVLFVSASFVPELIFWLQGDFSITSDAMITVYCCVAALYALTGAVSFAMSDYSGNVAQKNTGSKAKAKDVLFSSDDDAE